AYAAYCFCEYAAGYLFVAGCRNLHGFAPLTRRDWLLCLPAAGVAVALPWLTGSINGLMIVHALLMACLFAAAFAILFATRNLGHGAGAGVMMAALFVLAVDFLQYAPLCGYSYLTGRTDVFP